ncbi:hypothetical protein GEMRC1_003399 [Eukaryota sp. GEM-RC1]
MLKTILLLVLCSCYVLGAKPTASSSTSPESFIQYVRSKPSLTVDSVRDYINDESPDLLLNSTLLYSLTSSVFSHLSLQHNQLPHLWVQSSQATNTTHHDLVTTLLIDHYKPHLLLLNLTRELGGRSAPQANFDLAVLASLGLPYDVPAHPSLPFLSLTFSARGNFLPARLALGYRHYHGHGVPKDCKTAAAHLLAAVKDSLELNQFDIDPSKKSFLRLVEKSPGLKQTLADKYSLPLDFLRIRARHDTNAARTLGEASLRGLGSAPDPSQAGKIFHDLARRGDSSAMVNLAWMHIYGQGVEQNNKTALNLFAEANDHGNADGLAGLGYCFLHGAGVNKDLHKAAEYLAQSVEGGSVVGKYWMALCLWKGFLDPVVKKDHKLARSLFSEAYISGHWVAGFYLSQMYLSGEGGPAFCDESVMILRKLAGQSTIVIDTLSDTQKALLSHDYAGAMSHASKAASMGIEEGWASLAFMLRREPLVPEWKEKLEFALIRSTELGGVDSWLWLGKFYKRDGKFEKATEMFEKSCKFGVAEACFRLGYAFEIGQGVSRDFDLAKRYYDLCSEHEPIIGSLALFKLRLVGLYRWIRFREPLGNWWFFRGTSKKVPAVYEKKIEEEEVEEDLLYLFDFDFYLLIIFSLILLLLAQLVLLIRQRNLRR